MKRAVLLNRDPIRLLLPVITALALGANLSLAADAEGLRKFAEQIKKDRATMPLLDEFDGTTRNWTASDIVRFQEQGGHLKVITEWFPKPENAEPAKRMCKYISAFGDQYGFDRVSIIGQGDRTLTSCEKWP